MKAMRTGQRADGSPVLPPMPWPNYSRLSDEDAYAIAAYLKSIPAVKHRMPANLPPGTKPAGTALVIPPPSAWDAPKSTPGGAPADSAKKTS